MSNTINLLAKYKKHNKGASTSQDGHDSLVHRGKRKWSGNADQGDEIEAVDQVGKLPLSFTAKVSGIPAELKALIPNSEASAILDLGTLGRQKAMATCIPHVVKLINLSCAMMSSDQDFMNEEERIQKLQEEKTALQCKIEALENDLADKEAKLKVISAGLRPALKEVEDKFVRLNRQMADYEAELETTLHEPLVRSFSAVFDEREARIHVEKQRDEAIGDMVRVGEQSFANALEQIKALNPGVVLHLEGLDCYKIVKDGVIVDSDEVLEVEETN